MQNKILKSKVYFKCITILSNLNTWVLRLLHKKSMVKRYYNF